MQGGYLADVLRLVGVIHSPYWQQYGE